MKLRISYDHLSLERDVRRSEPDRGAPCTSRDRFEDVGHKLPAATDQRGSGRAEQLAGTGQIELAEAIMEGEIAAGRVVTS